MKSGPELPSMWVQLKCRNGADRISAAADVPGDDAVVGGQGQDVLTVRADRLVDDLDDPEHGEDADHHEERAACVGKQGPGFGIAQCPAAAAAPPARCPSRRGSGLPRVASWLRKRTLTR